MMTAEQKRLARHALGLTDGRKQSYRNRFAAPGDTDHAKAWDAMVANGLAVCGVERGSFVLFSLTPAGAAAALLPGETLDPEDFPCST